MDMEKNKFVNGDDVYVIDSKERNGTVIEIVKMPFNGYTDSTYRKATLLNSGNTYTTVNSWAIFKTKDDAAKFAIIHLIKTKEQDSIINIDINVHDQYLDIEKNHPELILKYMKHIINL